MKSFFLICGAAFFVTWLYICLCVLAAGCIGAVRSRRNRQRWQDAGSVAEQIEAKAETLKAETLKEEAASRAAFRSGLRRILQ